MGIKIDIKGFSDTIAKVEAVSKKVRKEIQGEMDDFALNVQQQAKRLAPADEGLLRNSINVVRGDLEVSVVVGTDYAAYVEFGTRKFAAAYVSGLPQDWKTYAAQFKGKGSKGDVFEFIKVLMAWVRRKGLSGTYSVKTQKRTGKKADRNNEDFDVAFGIALYILRNGIKAHPFLYPAYRDNIPKLKENLKKLFE